MNIAIIIAGGVGTRMGLDVPKQFVSVLGKPIIIYTLEAFENHPEIDAILAVCVDGWQEALWAYAKQHKIKKLRWVVTGGNTGQESIRNGINALENVCKKDDIAIIHDGIRPLVDYAIISDIIIKCRQHGNGVTSLPYNEQIFVIDDEYSTTQYIPRETLRRVSTPQAYNYGKIKDCYKRAFAENIGVGPSSYANTMMVELGERLYFAVGSDKNIKLTNKDDIELFKAFLRRDKE